MAMPASNMTFFFSSRRRHTRCYRDWSQTCALPIYRRRDLQAAKRGREPVGVGLGPRVAQCLGDGEHRDVADERSEPRLAVGPSHEALHELLVRSEELRVGKEGRARMRWTTVKSRGG